MSRHEYRDRDAEGDVYVRDVANEDDRGSAYAELKNRVSSLKREHQSAVRAHHAAKEVNASMGEFGGRQ